MLASEFHLSGKQNFERVLGQGHFFQAESFGLAFFDRRDGGSSKYGFIVSNKVSKEAVQRNRIKRALSEAVRFIAQEVKPGLDVVFLAKQTSTKMPTDAIMREVKEAFGKTGLLK